MSSVLPFVFNAVELCVVIINEKPWTRAKEVCRALEYGKATKTAGAAEKITLLSGNSAVYMLHVYQSPGPRTRDKTTITSMRKG